MKHASPAEAVADEPFITEVKTLRERARQHLERGLPYAEKMIYKEMFFRSHGKIPNWGLPMAKWSAETLKI